MTTYDLLNTLITKADEIPAETIRMIRDIIELEQRKDSLEIGKAGERIKVYVDFGNPAKARERIITAISESLYATTELDRQKLEKDGGTVCDATQPEKDKTTKGAKP